MSLNLAIGVQALKLTSPSFKNNKPLDKKFVYSKCGGENISPELRWSDIPQGTKSFVLICDDPDAPTPKPLVHWVVYNIPKGVTQLKEGESFKAVPATQGANSHGNTKYDGPCPPSGQHRYFFKLYALEIENIEISGTPDKDQVEKAIEGNVLAEAQLIGLYQK